MRKASAATSGARRPTETTPENQPQEISHGRDRPFTRTETGYAGKLHSFGLHEKLFIVPAKPSDVKNAPDYRVRLDSEEGPDAGPAWKDASENAGDFVSMRLEGPIFPFPIRAKLFQSNDDPSVWTLRWKHPRKVEDEE